MEVNALVVQIGKLRPREGQDLVPSLLEPGPVMSYQSSAQPTAPRSSGCGLDRGEKGETEKKGPVDVTLCVISIVADKASIRGGERTVLNAHPRALRRPMLPS